MSLQATLLSSLLLSVTARPQQSRVVFEPVGEEALAPGTCSRRDLLYWGEDGRCYTAGRRGPCKEGLVLGLARGRPDCVERVEEEEQEFTANCTGDEVFFEGGCHQLASTGPCEAGQWLVLVAVLEGQVEAECRARRCGEQEVWLSGSCSCLPATTATRSKVEEYCGEGGEVLVSPYGEGVCGCREGWEVGVAHGRQGVHQGACRRQRDSTTTTSTTTTPLPLGLGTRGIFDNVPVNDPNAFSRATLLNCYVDEAGNCRKTWSFSPKQRFAGAGGEEGDTGNTAQDLIDWLELFGPPENKCPAENLE